MDRGGRIVGMLAIAGAVCGPGVQPAAARAPLVFAIPGLSATTIRVEGVQRLDDGGALIAATLRSRGPHRPSHLALVRLLADGTPSLAYGSLGILTPALGDVQATALAVNPSTAEAWVGLAHPRGDRAEILAVDGRGRVAAGFGRRGQIALRAGAPQAIAWRPGQLLVAMGRSSCRGCTVGLASAATGRMSRTRRFDPGELMTNSGRCRARAISAALFTPGGKALLGVDAARPGCGAVLDQATPSELVSPGAALSAAAPFGRAVRTDMLGAFGAQTCVGGMGPRSTEFGSLDAHNTARPVFRGPPGGLVSIVALGHGACAVLVQARSGALVLQGMSRRQMSRDAIAPTIEPLGMFRCHQHLLVVGATRHGSAVVAVVPVRRGPYASAAATRTARMARSGSGCR